MSDAECVLFLQWALPRLRLRWEGFRRVRRQVCKRVARRTRELELPGLPAYRAYLEEHPEEWAALDELCRVTVSRFYRDRAVFDFLAEDVLPELAGEALARREAVLEVWSAGCASGEEAYTVALVWKLALSPRFPALRMRILATDADSTVLRRAREARYGAGSLRDLPESWRRRAFVASQGVFRLRDELRRGVTFVRHDVRTPAPGGPFHLVLCRNLAFTYFELELQREVYRLLGASLVPGGALVLGAHERLPEDARGFAPWSEKLGVYRRLAET